MNKNIDSNQFELKKLLKKFKKEQLFHIVFRMPCFRIDAKEDDMKFSKDQIAEGLSKVVMGRNLEDILAKVRLVYVQTHSNGRMWSVAEVKNMKGHNIQDPLSFGERLQCFLHKSHLSCKVTCQLHEQGYWTEINFDTIERIPQTVKSSHVLTYIVYFPQTPFLLYSGLRATHHKVLERALLQTLQGTKIKNLALNGRCIASLLRLALQQGGQDFSTGSGVPNLIHKIQKKKKGTREMEYLNIVNENEEESQEQEKYAEETFGPYELPHLEVITYKTTLGFYGFEEEKKDNAICRVKFKGQSVLEGFRDLVHHGFTHTCLPSYVSNVPFLGINRIKVAEKKRSCDGNAN